MKKREEEEAAMRSEQERQEAIKRLHAICSRREPWSLPCWPHLHWVTSSPKKPVHRVMVPKSVTKGVGKKSRCGVASSAGAKAGGSRTGVKATPCLELQVQPGESDLNVFAMCLLESVKELKDGRSAPFQP